jgi:hypothetical protein
MVLLSAAQARVITVTTTDSENPAPDQTSLLQAILSLADGDEIQFNISGDGPHYLPTPPGGYPLITNNRVTINGYSQPGSAPNTNPILAANNAKLQIVLDSRNGNFTSMNYQPDDNTGAGYDETEFAMLGVFRATNVVLQGLCLLGKVPEVTDTSNYGIAFARDYEGAAAGGRVSGCWIGVAPDGVTLSGTKYAITAFRHRDLNLRNQVTVDDFTVGVSKDSANPRAEFNVIVQTAIPIIVEGQGARISGNFLGVMPDGLTEVNVALDPAYSGDFQFEGAIEIGRANNNTVIGVDGDGVNDAEERNVIGGTMRPHQNGYAHTIEFYAGSPGANMVIAGNYIGVGIDGATFFTNGVPAINGAGSGAQYRVGSNLDGVSDELEGNFIVNNWPVEVYSPWDFSTAPDALGFFDELALTGVVSLRGNRLVNNFPFPVSPTKADAGEPGWWRTNYYAKALAAPAAGIVPVLSRSTTPTRLVGTAPRADTNHWPVTIIDAYVADRFGLTNGMEASIPELPFGFVQGWAYLGSYVDNEPADRNPNLGEFDFDLGPANLDGKLLTVTANYSTGPAGAPSAVVLTSPFSDPVLITSDPGCTIAIAASGERAVLTFTGVLQAAENVEGPYRDVVAAISPQAIPLQTNPRKFWRSRRP